MIKEKSPTNGAWNSHYNSFPSERYTQHSVEGLGKSDFLPEMVVYEPIKPEVEDTFNDEEQGSSNNCFGSGDCKKSTAMAGEVHQVVKAPEITPEANSAPAEDVSGLSRLSAIQIDELAILKPEDYEKMSLDKAKELGLSREELDEEIENRRNFLVKLDLAYSERPDWKIKHYPDKVNGAQLLDEIFGTLTRFVIADTEALEICATWIVLTYLPYWATVMPIAMITAPEKACGKTVILSIIGRLCNLAHQTSNTSSAGMYRFVDKFGPTLLIDEADTFMLGNNELAGIINSGHTRDSAFVTRCAGAHRDYQVERFSTWAPKAIAGINLEKLRQTLLSRSIIIPMRRKLAHEQADNLRHAEQTMFSKLKSKLLRWSKDIGYQFAKTRPKLPQLNNREMDNAEPLLAIAQLAGGDWPKRIERAVVKMQKAFADESLETRLLKDIFDVFWTKQNSEISTGDLLDCLNRKIESPWGTFNRGQPLGHNQLSNKLKPYGIFPNKLKGSSLRGYKAADFEDTFKRYIPDYADSVKQGCPE